MIITSSSVSSTVTSTQILDRCDAVMATVITGAPLHKVDQAEASRRGWSLDTEPTCCGGHGTKAGVKCRRCDGWGWLLSR